MTCKEKIVSQEFAEILVDYDIEKESLSEAYCYQPLYKELGVLYANLAYVEPLNMSPYRYTYIPKCYGLMQSIENDLSYEEIGAIRAATNPLNLTGKGVLIGLVDSGIRHTLSSFEREDGTSRILALWDQEDQQGTAPTGFLYGSEYLGNTPYRETLLKRYEENREERKEGQTLLLEENKGTLDTSGHGTKVALVALACAKDAHVVVVKCRQAKSYLRRYYAMEEGVEAYSESDLMTGIAYLKSISDYLQLPMVICFTMGTNMGSHAAHSLLDRYLGSIGEERGKCLVIGGGNEGNKEHHYVGVIPYQRQEEWDGYKEVEIYVTEGCSGFYLQLWGSLPAVYSISVKAPNGEWIRRIPANLQRPQEYSFIYSSTNIWVDSILVERSSSQQLIQVRLLQPISGIWKLGIYMDNATSDGQIHMWLPITQFLNQPVTFLEPNPYETMTEPSYLEQAISLSFYDANSGAFAVESGRGYQKRVADFFRPQVPDLAAPGVLVETGMGKYSGSSMAAALMSGACAQFLEWAVTKGQDPLVNSKGVRNYFIRGAKRNPEDSYPSATWGYGTASLTGVFEALLS